MSQNYVPNIGELAPENSFRDCVHMAVAPVIAAEELLVGSRVFIGKDGRACHAYEVDDSVGIVDPFLKVHVVKEGERFWLFMYPQTVTNLRHSWTHSAFQAKTPIVTRTCEGNNE